MIAIRVIALSEKNFMTSCPLLLSLSRLIRHLLTGAIIISPSRHLAHCVFVSEQMPFVSGDSGRMSESGIGNFVVS